MAAVITGLVMGTMILMVVFAMFMAWLEGRPKKRAALPWERRLLDQSAVLLHRMVHMTSEDRMDILSELSKEDATRLLRVYDEMRDKEIEK